MTRDDVNRRDFMKWGVFSGTALALGVSTERVFTLGAWSAAEVAFVPNQWIHIDTSGLVTVSASYSEMGQGVRTSVPMIIAEELGADWARVMVVHAQPGPRFRDMRTSGSSSVADAWGEIRTAAAAAREMLVAAAATQWNVAAASCSTEAGTVVHRASGRSLAFGDLVGRAATLPVPSSPPLKAAREYRLLGTRVTRVDAPRLVNGSAVFGLDARQRDVAVAVVARPPQHGARVKRWNDSRARAVAGVLDVVPVRTGVAVVAAGTWAAMQGCRALDVEWEESPQAQRGSTDYMRALAEAVDHGRTARQEGGNFESAMAGVMRSFDFSYETAFQGHSAMEPLNCIADVRDGRCHIVVGTQAPNQVQTEVAKLLGIPSDSVTVEVTLLGGGFGRRLDVDYAVEAADVSRAAKRAVQVVWTREDDTRHDRYQPGQVNRMTAGVDASGKIVAWRHRAADYHLTMFGAYDANYDPAKDGDPWGGFDTPYSVGALHVTLALLESPVPTGAWRSVSYPATVFARESFLDEIARATGQDPVALRLGLIPSPGIKRGRPNGDRLRTVVQLAADKADWSQPFAKTRGGRRWGRGFACNAYHEGSMVAQVAEVSVGAGGDLRVHRVVCAVDCGQVINREGLDAQFESGVAWALSAALKGRITFANGRTEQSNFHDFPVLRFHEAPVVEVHVVQSALRPFGVGEQPVPPVAPAVMNAYFDATGERVRALPFLRGG